jgi:Na+/proline symporter
VTTVVVFAVVGITGLLIILSQGRLYIFSQDPRLALPLFATSSLAALASGLTTYLLLKQKHDSELKELSSLIAQMKNATGEGSPYSSPSVAENALFIADRIVNLLPRLVRKRSQDSLLFGIAAFILVGLFSRNVAAAFIVGVIVWIYFRYETRKTYEEEIARFEEQRRAFEQRKKDFMESL